MDQIKLEELAVAYPDQEDLVQVYKEWGDSAYLQELFKVLDSYEPDWNKKRNWEVGRQSFCWISWKKKGGRRWLRKKGQTVLMNYWTKDMSIFVVVISLPGSIILTSTFRKGKTWMLFWPRGTKRLCFPNWACKAWDEWI